VSVLTPRLRHVHGRVFLEILTDLAKFARGEFLLFEALAFEVDEFHPAHSSVLNINDGN